MESFGQGSSSVGTRIFQFLNGIRGLGLSKCIFGRIASFSSIKMHLMTPASPAAPSRCPICANSLVTANWLVLGILTFDLTEPTSSSFPVWRPWLTVFATAASSSGSPAAVPVPLECCQYRGKKFRDRDLHVPQNTEFGNNPGRLNDKST